MSKTILYARVSTTDQTLDHQKDQAEAAGFVIDEVVADHGVSGVSTTLQERPEGKRLYDKLRHGDTLVVRWVDRLGRNYNDVTDTIRHFMRQGVVVKTVINGLTFDGATQDPMQAAVRDALIAFMAATAQAQAEAMKETQKAGIAAAKQDGTKYRGKKPSYDRKALDEVMDMLGKGAGASEIANTVEVRVKDGREWKARKLTRQTVLRIRKDPAAAEEALSKWGL